MTTIFLVDFKYGTGTIASYEIERTTEKMYFLDLNTKKKIYGEPGYQSKGIRKEGSRGVKVFSNVIDAREYLIELMEKSRLSYEKRAQELAVKVQVLRNANDVSREAL